VILEEVHCSQLTERFEDEGITTLQDLFNLTSEQLEVLIPNNTQDRKVVSMKIKRLKDKHQSSQQMQSEKLEEVNGIPYDVTEIDSSSSKMMKNKKKFENRSLQADCGFDLMPADPIWENSDDKKK